MADLFNDDFFDGGEPEQQQAPKPGLVLGERYTPEQFAAKFVGKSGAEGVDPVTFEVWDEATKSWVELPPDAPTPQKSKW